MAAELKRHEAHLELSLGGMSGPGFRDALAKVKEIPGARFNGELKVWELPLEPFTAQRVLHSIQPDADAAVLGWLRQEQARLHSDITTDAAADARLALPWAGPVGHVPDPEAPAGADALYPHQRAGIDFLAEHPHAILADDMGLGKTVQAIGAFEERERRRHDAAGISCPALIICPNTVKGNWASEIEAWQPGRPVAIIDGKNPATRSKQLTAAAQPDSYTIVNWEKLRIMPELAEVEWSAVIADEAHRAKNRKAQQTKALWRIRAPIQLALTGTPLMNSPDELWPLLKWLDPKTYTSYWTFYNKYVDYYEGYFGRIITGVRNPDALRFELADKLIRRTKHEVLDLPEKVRTFVRVPLKPKQRRIYEDAEKQLWLEIEREAAEKGEDPVRLLIANPAARTTRLRQVASSPALLEGPDESAKLDTAVELIEDGAGRPFVTFAEFKPTCRLLVARLAKRKIEAAALTGDESPAERTELVRRFQGGELDVLCCTLDAGGEGITLTRASDCIFIERKYVPARNRQPEDRLHRIGQHDPVAVTILEAVDTVDTGKVGPINRFKELIEQAVIDQDEIREEHGQAAD